MAKDDHWFKFFYKLFLISTQGWKDDEVGAYVKLLINQFDRGGLPDDEAELSKLITTFKKNWPLLQKKFRKCEDGFLRNDFMSQIRIERDEKSKKNSELGKLGGRPRKNQTEIESKPNGFKNKSHIYSYSSSPSDLEVKEGTGGKETIELPKTGFFLDEMDKGFELTEIQLGATVEYIRIKSKVEVSKQDVFEHWRAFKIQYFDTHEWYDSIDKLLKHFRDLLKVEMIKHGSHKQSPKDDYSKFGKAAGAIRAGHELAKELGIDRA